MEHLIEIKTAESQLKPHTDEPHNRKPIDRIVVSPDLSYVVTYSESDDYSIHGWSTNEQQQQKQQCQRDVGFKLDRSYKIKSFILHNEILLFYYLENQKSQEPKVNDHDEKLSYCKYS